jgi:hypothetical protein
MKLGPSRALLQLGVRVKPQSLTTVSCITRLFDCNASLLS